MLIELKDGGIKDISTDTSSYRGCETCDYGSEYVNELTIYFLNSKRLEIEAKAMYEFPLSMDFLMKLFLNNIDHIKTLTEEECGLFIINSVELNCRNVEVS